MIDEREVREMLRRRADGISAPPTDAPRALHRAHRRMVRTGIGAATALAVVAAAVVGLTSLHIRTAEPAIKPSINAVGFKQMRGKLVYDIGQALFAVDPTKPEDWKAVGLAPGWVDSWSADGSRLLILSFEWATGKGPSFYVLSADGSLAPLTTYPPAGFGSMSPDGAKVVYGSSPHWPGAGGLYVVAAGGGASRLLLPNDGSVPNTPSWSADGSKIAFFDNAAGKRGKVQNISQINPDGTGKRLLVDLVGNGAVDTFGLTWSPDGSMLAFSMGSSTNDSEIWVVGVDGSGLRKITHGGFDWSPVWSPDGSRIAFERNVRQHFVFTVAPDGSGLRMIDTVRPTGPITWNPVP